MSPSRQGVLLWEIPEQQQLPQAVQQRCGELLTPVAGGREHGACE
jgi:hypothetical protein